MTPEQIESIAMIAHEANKAYCYSIGDYSQSGWGAAPIEVHESVIAGVEFCLTHDGVTPERVHENWLADKEAAGWQHGPTKNYADKTHPNFAPYWELPAAERAKDALFVAVVKTLILAHRDVELEKVPVVE